MKKTKRYPHTYFSADVLREGYQTFLHQINPRKKHQPIYSLNVDVDGAEIGHDSVEEFFSDYRQAKGSACFRITLGFGTSHLISEFSVSVFSTGDNRNTTIEIKAPDRSKIEAVFNVFEKHAADSKLPVVPSFTKPTIFIGHGQDIQWRDIKDHLQDKHGYEIVTYEVGARAGHEIRDILEEMLKESAFAILVMTGEDETKDGKFQPRLNVVHELGLFQGRLGFSRAIILLEEGVEEFSNIFGVHQIRFSKGNIKATFGDVLATLRREFPESSG